MTRACAVGPGLLCLAASLGMAACRMVPAANPAQQQSDPGSASQGRASCLARIGADVPLHPERAASHFPPPASSPAKASKDVALIVAIEHYGESNWVGAAEAALLWEQFFTASLGIPAEKVLRLHALDADAEGMRGALEKLAGLSRPGGHAWFVFLGLAAKDPAKKVGQDAVLAGVAAFSSDNRVAWKQRGLSAGEIVTLLRAGQGMPIVVVDAAVDAGFETTNAKGAGTPATEPVALPLPGRGVVLGRTANDRAQTYPGTLIPAFSYLLLGALRGWGDLDHDGRVTADEAWQYTRQRLTRLSGVPTDRLAERPNPLRGSEVLSHGAETEPAFVEMRPSDPGKDTVVFNRDGLVLPDLPRPPRELPAEWEDKTYLARCHPHGWAPGEAPAAETGGDVEGAYRQCPGGTSVGLWAAAWCAQGGSRCANRFALKANDLCTRLTRYGEQKRRLVAALARDWPVLEGMLARAPGVQDKTEILRTFREQYPMLSELGLEGALERACAHSVQSPPPVDKPSLPAGAQWITIEGGAFRRGQAQPYKRWVNLRHTSGWWRLLDDGPADWVLVDRFEMLKTEVTVAQYRACVEKGQCTPPRASTTMGHANYQATARDDHPINHVDWEQAKAFCAWIGARLPSETEWDYAATSRGKYANPWGNEDSCERVVKFQVYDPNERCGDDTSGTRPVGSRPGGNSEQGVCDLMGNVWEWVADGVHPNYCGAPGDGSVWAGGSTGAETGRRLARGGSWHDEYELVGLRVSLPADRGGMDLGFRCARRL